MNEAVENIVIRNIAGGTRCMVAVNEGSERVCKLNLEADYVILNFSTESPVPFKLGDWCEIPGEGRFEYVDKQLPSLDEETGACEYTLKMEAPYMKWRNKIFKYTPSTGGYEAEWNLTAPLHAHLNILLDNLRSLGYNHTYTGADYSFSIDDTVEESAKLITYSNTDIISALIMMAQTWECDVWIEDNIIRFGRCEATGNAVMFSEGDNVCGMQSSKSAKEYATRIYAFGSTRNLPVNYRPIEEGVVVNGIVQKRLMLPAGTPYVDAMAGMTTEEAIESVVTFDDVYPRTDGVVDAVTSYDDTTEDESGNKVKETFYRFTEADADFRFSKDYILPNEELKVVFQSGTLNGMHFGVNFNPLGKPEKLADGSWNMQSQVFEIVANENYGRKLPDDTLHPAKGDKYVLYGWDSTKITDLGLVTKAEKELLEEARKYVEKSKVDPNTYDCPLFSDYAYGLDSNGNRNPNFAKRFYLGDKVILRNPVFFGDGTLASRIIAYQYPLDKPYDTPHYTVGETAAYSRLNSLERKVDTLTMQGKTYTGGGGSSVYVISTKDQTPETDRNVYSALRVLQDFLSKKRDDRSSGKLASDIGFEVGQFVSGVSGAILRHRADGTTELEVDRIWARIKAVFESLVSVRTEALAGEQLVTPGGAVPCSKVESHDGYWRCYFLAEQDGEKIKNLFKAGDQARCNDFNMDAGQADGVASKFYWRLVTGVSSQPVDGYHYIDLSRTDCADGSDAPAAGDTITQLGNRSEKERQNAIRIATVFGDVPSIKLLNGIDSYTLEGKDAVSMGVDSATGRPYLRCYGDVHFGSRNGKGSTLDYNSAAGVMDYKGRISTRSAVVDGDGKETLLEDYVKAGEHLLRLDLSNEVEAIACDAKGNPVKQGALATTKVSVYRGAQADAASWTIKAVGTGCTATVSGDMVTVNSMSADTAKVEITASNGTQTLSASMSLYKVIPGAAGKDAVIYSAEASVNAIKRSAIDGTLIPASLTLAKYMTVGSSPRQTTTEKVLYYHFLLADGTETSPSIALPAGSGSISVPVNSIVPADAVAAVLTLREAASTSSAVLDRETIPVLTDISDMETGTGNLLLNTAFEDGESHWFMNSYTAIDSDVRFNGKASFRIDRSGATSDEFRGLVQRAVQESNPALILAGQRYVTASVWAYCDTDAALQTLRDEGAKLELAFTDEKGARVRESRSVSIVPTKTGEWQRFHITVRTDISPDEAHAPFIYAYVVRNGRLWLAQPQLEWGNILTPWSANPQDASSYITAALQRAKSEEGSIEGGLVLASLIRLGYTAVDGEYRVMSGLSGIADNADDIALWTGGDMIDAAKHPENPRKALAVIRHAGTSYFCGNTVRFYDDHMEIGDASGEGAMVTVDRTGLYLKDENGYNRLAVKNENIPLDLSAATTVVPLSADGDATKQISIGRTNNMTTGGMVAQNRYYISSGCSTEHGFSQALTEGSHITGAVQMQFDFQLPHTTDGAGNMIITMPLQVTGRVSVIRVMPSGVESVVTYRDMAFSSSQYGTTFRHTAKATINQDVPADGTYKVRTEILTDSRPLGTAAGNAAVGMTANGKATLGVEGQTVIGLNGLMSVWDNARMVLSSNADGGFFGVLAGNNGLRITSGRGFEKTLDSYNGEWKACYLPDK